jgi:Transcriptional regulator, Out at first
MTSINAVVSYHIVWWFCAHVTVINTVSFDKLDREVSAVCSRHKWHRKWRSLVENVTRWKSISHGKMKNAHTNFYVIFLQGGEVVQETITSNIHDDIITLEFQRTDGTLITQLIDFRSVSIVDLFLFLDFWGQCMKPRVVWAFKTLALDCLVVFNSENERSAFLMVFIPATDCPVCLDPFLHPKNINLI